MNDYHCEENFEEEEEQLGFDRYHHVQFYSTDYTYLRIKEMLADINARKLKKQKQEAEEQYNTPPPSRASTPPLEDEICSREIGANDRDWIERWGGADGSTVATKADIAKLSADVFLQKDIEVRQMLRAQKKLIEALDFELKFVQRQLETERDSDTGKCTKRGLDFAINTSAYCFMAIKHLEESKQVKIPKFKN